ncbi:hypothetical protein FGO68_gene5047 [Halteria grandinella]|uniref:Uncharacterized protein n=1 Tax=Halteria grandinella TaxID=5974 RepID=A0A8J8T829_HALGN|nr:hypothetical protein FGO68_gene5047 [Halteria grandinella]
MTRQDNQLQANLKQVKEAQELIVERHPLRYANIPLEEILPFVGKLKKIGRKVINKCKGGISDSFHKGAQSRSNTPMKIGGSSQFKHKRFEDEEDKQQVDLEALEKQTESNAIRIELNRLDIKVDQLEMPGAGGGTTKQYYAFTKNQSLLEANSPTRQRLDKIYTNPQSEYAAKNKQVGNRPSDNNQKNLINFNSLHIARTPDDHLKPNEEFGINSHFKASNSNVSSPRISYRAQAIKKAEKGRFLSLGYGLVAYFDTLTFFIKLFGLYSILSIISLIIIGFLFDSPKNNLTITARHSLGIMGQSEPLCVQTDLGVKNVNIKCNSGFIEKIHSIGIISKEEIDLKNEQDIMMRQKNFFSPREKGQRCISQQNDKCNGIVNEKRLTPLLESECIGQRNCKLSNLTAYLHKDMPQQCLSEESMFFIQVSCQEATYQQFKKKFSGLIISTIVCFQGLFFFISISKLKKKSSEEFEQWDKDTVTTSDYTVACTIDRGIFEEFSKREKRERQFAGQNENTSEPKLEGKQTLFMRMHSHFFNNDVKESRIYRFKEYFTNEIEQILNQQPQRTQQAIKRVKIVDTVFAFSNSDLLNMLKMRGKYIKYNMNRELAKLDIDLGKYVQRNGDVISRPTKAFITFEDEEGYQRACHLDKKSTIFTSTTEVNLNGNPIYFKAAPEASNVIWENQYTPTLLKLYKRIVALLIVLFILVTQVVFIFALNKKIFSLQEKYPSIDCEDVLDSYGDEIQKYALQQWNDLVHKEENTDKQDALQCICEGTYEKHGFAQTFFKKFRGQSSQNHPIEGYICRDLMVNYSNLYLSSVLISFLVVTFNFILRTTIIALIKWIGKKTFSGQYKTTAQMLFLTQFINSAVILVLVHANFENSSFPIVNKIFNGEFPDFTQQWYNRVGSIITQTLVIIGLATPIDCLYVLAWTRYKQFRDTGHWSMRQNEVESNSKTVAQLVSNYSAPEMLIDYRYAAMMLNIFIAMMFGSGIPILIPIALFNLALMYVLDRLMTVYVYSQPPLFGIQITHATLETLKWAAILHLSIGYWMLSNMQIFGSVINPKSYANEVLRTGHSLNKIDPLRIDHSTLLLISVSMVFLYLIAESIFSFINNILLSHGNMTKELMSVEGLANFYDSLYKADIDLWIKEETSLRNKKGFKKMKDYSLGRMILANISHLANKKRHEEQLKHKGLQTVGTYDILSQPRYKRKFQYIPNAQRKGKDLFSSANNQYVSCDKLRSFVDYPYLKND